MSDLLNLSHAKKLRYLRKHFDKKQSDIAKVLSVSQQAYSDLENGKTYFTDEAIEKLASYFKITPADFERPLEQTYIGGSNSNNNSHINNTMDYKLVEQALSSKDETIAAQKELLAEIALRIKLLEELRKKK
jgi:transcriptional regulator with XRE-family HTH domain